MLYKVPLSHRRHDMGLFTIIPNLPGLAVPGHGDHGYGPLARYDESIMRPGAFIRMHEHRNDEIISYMTDGLMRHSDRTGGAFTIGPDQIMVMNAGKSFWHEEQTKPSDETARFLQIFVRPRSPDLTSSIQLRNIERSEPNTWRLLAGPDGYVAPVSIRNEIFLYDARLARGSALEAPHFHGWDTLIHAYRGTITVNGTRVDQAEGALLVEEPNVTVTAHEDTITLAFLINRAAPVTHAGTIGQ